jgi:uncharacterized membrane protein
VGNYVAYVLIKFNGKIGTASEVFEIIAKPAKLLSLPVSYIYMIFGLILIIIVLMIFEYLKHHYKKENKKEEVYIEIKPKIEKKFDVNKLLKESNNEDSHKFHKKTLETKLKVLKQDYELGLMGQEEYLKAKRKIEKIFKKI